MKKLVMLLVIVATIMVTGCGKAKHHKSADKKMQEQTAQQMSEAEREIGMPAIKNFQERKEMKWILEARDKENLVCYAYLYNRDRGTVGQFLGKCIGYGLPYSVQYTNPMKIINGYKYLGYGVSIEPMVIPQADPNGLFMPTGLSATWLFLLDKQGNPHPVYVEPEIIVSPFPLNNHENK